MLFFLAIASLYLANSDFFPRNFEFLSHIVSELWDKKTEL